MKVLYTTQHDPNFPMAGAEQVLLDVALAMRDLFKVQVAVVVNEGDLAEVLRKKQIPVTTIPWKKIQTLGMLQGFKQALQEFRPDLIHAFHRYPPFLLETFLGQRNRTIYSEGVLRRDKKLLFRYGRLVIACHQTVHKNLRDYYKVPEKELVTIPNAVRAQVPDPEALEKLRKQFVRQPGEVWGLCVARLEEQKGHPYLIDAFSKLSQNHQRRLKIFLAGEGSKRPLLEAQAAKLGCRDQIVFLGHTKQVAEWLALSDFMILPSLWEGMPLVIMEAYSAAKPVIATDIPGSRESMKDHQTGILVKVRDPLSLKDALEYFMDHPADVFHYGRQAYNWWQEAFTFEAMIESYHDLYKQLLARM